LFSIYFYFRTSEKSRTWWGTFVTKLFFTEIKSRQGHFFHAKKNTFFHYCLFFYRGKSELGGINMSLTYFLPEKVPRVNFCTVKCYLFLYEFFLFFLPWTKWTWWVKFNTKYFLPRESPNQGHCFFTVKTFFVCFCFVFLLWKKVDLEGKCVTETFFTERKSPLGSLDFTVKVCLFVFFTVDLEGKICH
jgi:hypothetical protein